MNLQEAINAWRADQARFEALGVIMPHVRAYLPDEFRHNSDLAMDAVSQLLSYDANVVAGMPTLSQDPNNGVPALFTTMVDPQVFEIIFAPNKAADIIGENKRGTWLDDVILFPQVEGDGEVSSYGDWNDNAMSNVNAVWPARQSYLFQTIKEYGERQLERMGQAKINLVSEIDKSAARNLAKFLNFTYFFGVARLKNYGLLNDPNLSASLTPATKTAGGTAWVNSSGVVVATANEIYTDIQSLFVQLVSQTQGTVALDSKLILAMSPASEVGMTATNSFNVNVKTLLKGNFPNIEFQTAMQYGVSSSNNPQGIAAGNLVQLIAPEVEAQKTGFAAFNEKMRAHPIVRSMSSFRQKVTSGTWGSVIRMPLAISSMVGV